MTDRLFDVPLGSTARLSLDEVYRYELTRRWGGGPQVTFIMLNPSTADATKNDPTIRRCRGFAHAWGMGGLRVVNLFALRATDPWELVTFSDPVGPGNDDAIYDAIRGSQVVCVAWGAHKMASERAGVALGLLEELGRQPMCLGVTKSGYPRHPLRVVRTTKLVRYVPRQVS